MNVPEQFEISKFKQVYSEEQKNSISLEFKRCQGLCYLDHAGTTLYGEGQIEEILKDLKENVYGNPHSVNTTSKLTNDAIDIIRLKCLKHFNTNPDKYSLIFTSGATESLKIIGESFDYKQGSLVYLEDNHTSVLGMRDYVENKKVILCDEADFLLNKTSFRSYLNEQNNSLFVYPAQSNFNGKKYPLNWIKNVQNGVFNDKNNQANWYCMLDAASFVSTNDLDLSLYEPDFVSISFYKIFGYPTGLGALLVRNGSETVLYQRKYYGGGTVLMTMSTENIVFRRNNLHSRFEDGTLPFLSILSLKSGFQQLEKFNLNMDLISKHTFLLAKYAFLELKKLHHSNGKPVVFFYHDEKCFHDISHQGGIVNFNLLRSNGNIIGFAEINHVANLFGIQLRTGCFCNPGACQKYLKLSKEDVFYHFEQGHVCGDQKDLINGIPTGSIRISFGYMSTKKDVDVLLKMIEDCFLDKNHNNKFVVQKNLNERKNFNLNHTGILESIYLYPIKSCGFYPVSKSWRLISHGLKYDREFMITDHRGVCLTQKHNSNLCKIKPILNLEEKNLTISFQNVSSKIIPLNGDLTKFESYKCESKVCGDPIQAFDCGKGISKFLSDILGLEDLKLLRHCGDSNQKRTKELKHGQLSLVNEAQFLLINRKSVEWLWERIDKDNFDDTVEDLIERFRPNFVVNFNEPFIENSFKKLFVDQIVFKNVGKCIRCQMVCINQKTGEKNVDVLRTLSKEFNGKISFGIYLKREDVNVNKESEIFVNSKVTGFCGN